MYPKGKGPKGPSVAEAVLAVQRQITEHFVPAWGCGASLSLHRMARGDADALEGFDGIVYISPRFQVARVKELGKRQVDRASAFHYKSYAGIPCGFVYPEIASVAGVEWSVLLSHEILELIVDPDLNLLVGGVLPGTKHTILVAYEVCDPVQCSTYPIGDIRVGNFVTPQYFKINPREPRGHQPTNHLDIDLPPFDVLRGGCYWYFDPGPGTWKLYAKADYRSFKRARDRLGDVPRTRRRIARFIRRESEPQWDTLWYGCADYSPRCGDDDGGN